MSWLSRRAILFKYIYIGLPPEHFFFLGSGCIVFKREIFFWQSGALLRVLVGKARDRAARMYNKVEVKGGLITKVLLTYFYYY